MNFIIIKKAKKETVEWLVDKSSTSQDDKFVW